MNNHDENCPRKRPPPFYGQEQQLAAAQGPGAPSAVSKSKKKRKHPTTAGATVTINATGGSNGIDVSLDRNGQAGFARNHLPATANENGGAPPRRIGNSIDFPLSNLSSVLQCPLCHGYFRDPQTVADCLHTFCRSCLILFFQHETKEYCCPTCNSHLGPDPFNTGISTDRTLQEVIDKIFPHMKATEEEDERLFYERRGIELKPPTTTVRTGTSRSQGRGKVQASTRSTDDLLLDLKLEPDHQPPNSHQRLPSLRSPLLRTSGRLKVVSLKKYLIQRLGMKNSIKNVIEILCDGDPMGDELSLTFITRTRWFYADKILTLQYRLEGEGTRQQLL